MKKYNTMGCCFPLGIFINYQLYLHNYGQGVQSSRSSGLSSVIRKRFETKIFIDNTPNVSCLRKDFFPLSSSSFITYLFICTQLYHLHSGTNLGGSNQFFSKYSLMTACIWNIKGIFLKFKCVWVIQGIFLKMQILVF